MAKTFPRRLFTTLILFALILGTNIPVGASSGVEPGPEPAGLAVSGPGRQVYLPVVSQHNIGTLAPPSPASSNFMYGILDSAGFVGSPVHFERYIKDWQSRGFDAALLMNAVPDLSVSDRLNFKIIASPLGDLYREWFYYENNHNGAPLCGGNVTIDCARNIIGPIVDPIKTHPSVRGYFIFNDATMEYQERIRLATQVFKERDRLNPASPGLLELGYGQEVFEYTRPEAFITYDYPVLENRQPCDFSKGTYRDWVDRLRETMQARPMSVPYWAILQAHGGDLGLRTPTVEEVRLLNWLALGEDAKGVFWFIWSTFPDQFWTGIQDNPALLAEVTDLARRVNSLRPTLAEIRKISDKFQVAPAANAYVSTLKDFSTGKLYVLAANHSCAAQNLTLSSWFYSAKLKDLETGAVVDLGAPQSFRGGDGRLYEVVDATLLPPPASQANLVQNPSFEIDTDANGLPDNWETPAVVARDMAVSHTGSASFRITGPNKSYAIQYLTLKPGTRYYVSWYVKGQGLVESELGLQNVQTRPSLIYLDYVHWKQNGSYPWVKRVGFFETPRDYINGNITITWDVKSGGTFWIDDLTLCAADEPCADAYLIERE